MPTKLMGFISISSIFNNYQEDLLYIIIVMIIRRVLQASRLWGRRRVYFFGSTNIPLMQYQKFFKEVQKANEPSQAISTYKSYVRKEGNYDDYFAITLRILSRLVRAGENEDAYTVKTFFYENFKKLKQIDVKQLQLEYVKDIMFFYLHYGKYYKIQPHQIEILENYLKQFLLRFDRFEREEKLLLSSIVLSCIPFTADYLPLLTVQFVNRSYDLLEYKPAYFMGDKLNFQNILYILQDKYDLPQIQKFMLLFFKFLQKQTFQRDYSERALTIILMVVTKINSNHFFQTEIKQILDSINEKVQNCMDHNFLNLKAQTFQHIIPHLLQYQPHSILLKKYFKIIQNSIINTGEAKINPQILICSLSYLKNQEFNKLFNQQWTDIFLKMSNLYFYGNTNLQKLIMREFVKILQTKMLTWRQSRYLYQTFCIDRKNTELSIKSEIEPKLRFQKIFAHIMFLNWKLIFEQLVAVSNSMTIKEKPNTFNRGSNYSNYFDLRVFINGIIEGELAERNLVNQADLYPALIKGLRLQNQVKFNTDFMIGFYRLKIKLNYLNFSFVGIQNLLSPFEGKKIQTDQNRKSLTKAVIFESHISRHHYSQLVDFLLSFNFSEKQIEWKIEIILYQINMEPRKLFENYAEFIYYFYQRYFPNKFAHILIEYPYLLEKLMKIYPQKIRTIVLTFFKNEANTISTKYCSLLEKLILEDSSISRSKQQSMGLFKRYYSVAAVITKQNQSYFQQVVALLNNFIIENWIIESDYVTAEMNKIIQSSIWKRQQSAFTQSKKVYFEKLITDIQSGITRKDIHSQIEQTVLHYHKCIATDVQTHPQLIKLYIAILQKLKGVGKVNVYQANSNLKSFMLKNITSKRHCLDIINYLSKQKCWLAQFNCDLFQKINQLNLIDSTQFLEFFSLYPLAKTQEVLYLQIDQICRYPQQSIIPFCLIYTLIEKPKSQLKQFMKKYTLRYSKTIPEFFKVFLFVQQNQWASRLKIDKNILQQLTCVVPTQNEIYVREDLLEQLFERNKIVLKDWKSIQGDKLIEGCHKMIIRKILNKLHPEKPIRFSKKQQTI